MGYSPDKVVIGGFLTYLEELKRWNKAYNLTALKSDEEIAVGHFIDSALYLKVMEGRDISSVADVGSGAGFPGIPIKLLMPGLKVYLIEPSRKKCAFLRHIKGVLGLSSMEIMEKRVEDISGIEVDAALTRALFKTPEFVNEASKIVKKGGFFLLSKGPKVMDELKGADFKYEIVTLVLPISGIKRNLVLVYK